MTTDGDPFTFTTEWYTPSSFRRSDDGGSMKEGDWEALVALLDPITYFKYPKGSRYTRRVKQVSGKVVESPDADAFYSANTIPTQTTYEDPDTVAKAIADNLVLTTFNATIQDTVIKANDTMNIPADKDVKFYMWPAGSEPTKVSEEDYYADLPNDATHWKESADGKEITIDSEDDHAVNVAVSNIFGSAWTKVEIPVRTEAGFMDVVKADAEGDQKFAKKSDDGKSYQINPNDGDAKLTLYRSTGASTADAICAAGAAAIAETWDIPAENKKFLVDSADAVRCYDGIATNIFIAVTNADLAADAYKIEFQNKDEPDPERWTDYYADNWDENWPYVDVANSTSVVFRVTATGYDDYYGTNTVTITQRWVTVSAARWMRRFARIVAPRRRRLSHSIAHMGSYLLRHRARRPTARSASSSTQRPAGCKKSVIVRSSPHIPLWIEERGCGNKRP